MCRLFGMTTDGTRVRAGFWLLEAPCSMHEQSHRMPDGTGLGWFSLGDLPVLDKAPIPAYKSSDFSEVAQIATSHTFMAHLRYASTGNVSVHNTHPFSIDDRLFAHNGIVHGVDVIDSWLSDTDRVHLRGHTDSEYVFAFLSAEIRRIGETTAGIISGVEQLAKNIPIFALNFLIAEPGKLWALRYPDTNPLWVLEADAHGFESPRRLISHDEPTEMALEIEGSAGVPATIVASERLDDDPGWRLMQPGELLIAEGTTTHSISPFDAPAYPLRESDLTQQEYVSHEELKETSPGDGEYAASSA